MSSQYVFIDLCDDEADELRELDGKDREKKIEEILNDHSEDWEHFAHHFVKTEARYTLDDESVSLNSVEMIEPNKWKLHADFTQSVYWGCRDMDDLGDEQGFTLDVEIDLERMQIRVGGDFQEKERETFEEF